MARPKPRAPAQPYWSARQDVGRAAPSDLVAIIRRELQGHDVWPQLNAAELLELSAGALLLYGATADAAMIADLMPLYRRLMQMAPASDRLELYLTIARAIEAETTGLNAMMPFLLIEDDAAVVSTAVLDYVMYRQSPVGNPLLGAIEAIDWVKSGHAENRGAMLGGLITVGDERVHRLLEPLLDAVTEDEVNVAVKCRSGFPNLSTFAFWLRWLESIPAQEDDGMFGSVASGLALLRSGMKVPFFLTGLRPLGRGSDVKNLPPTDSEVVISIEDLGRRFSPRLYALEEQEAPLKIMSQILIDFGLEPHAPIDQRFVLN